MLERSGEFYNFDQSLTVLRTLSLAFSTLTRLIREHRYLTEHETDTLATLRAARAEVAQVTEPFDCYNEFVLNYFSIYPNGDLGYPENRYATIASTTAYQNALEEIARLKHSLEPSAPLPLPVANATPVAPLPVARPPAIPFLLPAHPYVRAVVLAAAKAIASRTTAYATSCRAAPSEPTAPPSAPDPCRLPSNPEGDRPIPIELPPISIEAIDFEAISIAESLPTHLTPCLQPSTGPTSFIRSPPIR